ncbi:hypothetical protein MRB53_037366 [Persea americana]|nr:hypothetical protein MRB53_037366 [Persea americana]
MPKTGRIWKAQTGDDIGLVRCKAPIHVAGLTFYSNGIRNDLQHPNEYIRGNTLRFLSKLREPELIEPLLSSARSCLEHRHAYVRKNAVFAVASIYQHSESLIPDAPELIETFLDTESDHTCKRNAFVALQSISQDKAQEYLSKVFDGIPNANELIQLVELEFIRKDAVTNSHNKAKYLRLIFDLLEASAPTVIYEAASSLTSLTSNPVAVKAAASKFIELCIKESDNNVKLIVLDKVDQLRQRNPGILDDLTMEILRVLSSPDLDVRRKALALAMEMVSSKNVEEVVQLLKKELSKTVDEQYERFPKLRPTIVERLVSTLSEVRAGKVYRGALWIVGEYSLEVSDIRDAWKRIRASLGEIPILASEQRLLEEVPNGDVAVPMEQVNGHKPQAPTGSRKVLADGTYATESALTSQSLANAKLEAVKAAQKPPLRQLILDGDYFLATVLCSTLTKLVMRHSEISDDAARTNSLRAEAMLIMISIVRVGQSQFVKAPIDEDTVDRIMSCVRSLAEFAERKELETVFLDDTRKAFRAMVQVEEKKRAAKLAIEKAKTAIQVDDVVTIRQLTKKATVDGADDVVQDLEKATGGDADLVDLHSKLSRVVQLTGFSDPVYAEAYVKVHQFDIVLDVLLVNQTTSTLQNLSIEFATLGDLKVVERPTTQNLGPHDFLNVQSTIKVSSTDTGVIFGNVVYDGASSAESNVVILNDVHVDIMDYIQPATCTETQFRSMWTEFEWGEQGQHQHKGKVLERLLEAPHEVHKHELLDPRSFDEGRLPVPQRKPLRQECLRRRCARQLERGARGRRRPCHRFRPDTESLAGTCIELGCTTLRQMIEATRFEMIEATRFDETETIPVHSKKQDWTINVIICQHVRERTGLSMGSMVMIALRRRQREKTGCMYRIHIIQSSARLVAALQCRAREPMAGVARLGVESLEIS